MSESQQPRKSGGAFFGAIGGRKFALTALAIVALVVGAIYQVDEDTKKMIVFLALGGGGLVALEDIFGKKGK